MKKIILTLLVLAFLVCSATAAEFLTTSDVDGENDYIYSVSELDDGSYVITGRTWNATSTDWNVLLSKFDSNGLEKWSKILSGVGEGGYMGNDFGRSVTATSDGGYIVAGEVYDLYTGLLDILLSKFDSNDNEEWTKVIGGSEDERVESVVQTSDGGYVVAGDSESFGGWDFFLSKFNSTGGEEWTTSLSGNDNDYGQSVIETSDGGYVLVGHTRSNGDVDGDFLVSKFNSSGGVKWTRAFGGGDVERAYSVTETPEGDYILAGDTRSYPNDEYREGLLAKFNSSGVEQWFKIFSGSMYESINSVATTHDGGYVLTGYTDSYGEVFGNNMVLIAKFNISDEEQWTNNFGGGISGRQGYIGASVIGSVDGGYAVAGHAECNSTSSVDDALLAKLDDSGYIDNCSAGNFANISGNWQDWNSVTVDHTPNLNADDRTGVFTENNNYTISIKMVSSNQTRVCGYDFILPLASSFTSNSRTTNFSNVSNLSAVENLTLGTDYGSISFGNHTVDAEGEDYDSNVIFGDCFVAVNSTNLDYSFNATAYLLMNNSDGHCGDNTIFTSDDVVANAGMIKANGRKCEECETLISTSDFARYQVPHFSSYAIGSNANMTIDANDPKQINQTVIFTAVYRNSTGGSFISGANCQVGLFNGTTEAMSSGTGEYTFQTSFDTAGDYGYNITCSATGYQTLKTNDTFTIISSSAEVPEFNGIVILALVAGLVMLFFLRGKK